MDYQEQEHSAPIADNYKDWASRINLRISKLETWKPQTDSKLHDLREAHLWDHPRLEKLCKAKDETDGKICAKNF